MWLKHIFGRSHVSITSECTLNEAVTAAATRANNRLHFSLHSVTTLWHHPLLWISSANWGIVSDPWWACVFSSCPGSDPAPVCLVCRPCSRQLVPLSWYLLTPTLPHPHRTLDDSTSVLRKDGFCFNFKDY